MSNLLMLAAEVNITVDPKAFCMEAREILVFVGYVLTIFKIGIPLLIVALGMFDFGKAVVAGKDDEIKKQSKTLMLRAIAGVIIFLVPSIVMWLFGTISGFTDGYGATNFEVCEDAILRPWDAN